MKDKIENALMFARIWRFPRRAFPRGPYLEPHPHDLLIAQAFEDYAKNETNK